MVEWITLIVTTLGLIVATIAEREKLSTFWREVVQVTRRATGSTRGKRNIALASVASRAPFTFWLLIIYGLVTANSLVIGAIFLVKPASQVVGVLTTVLVGGTTLALVDLAISIVYQDRPRQPYSGIAYFLYGGFWGGCIGMSIMTSSYTNDRFLGFLATIGYVAPISPSTFSDREFFFWMALWAIVDVSIGAAIVLGLKIFARLFVKK